MLSLSRTGTPCRPTAQRPREAERVRVHLDDGVQQRVEAGDLVQVELDERRRGEAAVLETQVDGVHGTLLELELGLLAAGAAAARAKPRTVATTWRRRSTIAS
jgi:hypothetical protein